MKNLSSIASSLRYKVSRELFTALGNTTYAHIKGEVLSLQAYGSVGNRNTSDIDLLIPRKELSKVEKMLIEIGFKQPYLSRSDKIMILSSSHQTLPWYKKINSLGYVNIDLNLDLFWGEYEGKRINISKFLDDNIEVEIYGCRVKTLSPLKAMVQLVLHDYKDLNSIFLLATRRIINLGMFKDIYYLLKNNIEDVFLDKLYAISSEYEIIPYVYYVLYHTGLLYHDETLQKYIKAFKTSEGEALLNCYGLNESERREWKFDFKTRLESQNLYELIRNDLTDKDREKILINKKVFIGE